MNLVSGIIPTLIAVFAIQLYSSLVWHGQIIINSVMDSIWNTIAVRNLNSYTKTGDELHIISKPFIKINSVGMGETRMTLTVIMTIRSF